MEKDIQHLMARSSDKKHKPEKSGQGIGLSDINDLGVTYNGLNLFLRGEKMRKSIDIFKAGF